MLLDAALLGRERAMLGCAHRIVKAGPHMELLGGLAVDKRLIKANLTAATGRKDAAASFADKGD
jgi:hypothetical protein